MKEILIDFRKIKHLSNWWTLPGTCVHNYISVWIIIIFCWDKNYKFAAQDMMWLISGPVFLKSGSEAST